MNSQTTKYRLLFLTVNSSFSHSSLALPLLHTACKNLANWEWVRYDMTIASDVMSALEEIYSYRCDLLATDLYLFNRQTALEVLERYHTLAPSCRIVAGGPECLGSGADELLEKYPFLDCVFRGEGENIFREYLENIFSRERDFKGILPADGNAVYEAWANSPYPVTDQFFTADKPFVQIETSRGCPMKCFYCTSGNTQTRYRTLEAVHEELKLLSDRGVKEVRVLDRTFNLPQERGEALLRMFREDFPEMKFHLELHPQFLNDSLCQEISRALPGQLHIEVGIQSLNSDVQQFSGRRSNTQAALDGLKFLCSSTAFETHADLLAGLPGETLDHIISDTATLMALDTAEIQLEVLKALPGTPLREIAGKFGIKYSPNPPYDVMQTNTMTLSDMQKAKDLSRLLDITYNHRFLHIPVKAMSEECKDFVVKLLEFFHQSGGSSSTVWDLKKRFLFLLNFCQVNGLKTARRHLAYQWLLAGYLPNQGPDEYSQKVETVPEDAQLVSGDPACLNLRESRYWQFALTDKIHYLAYNRQFALNRPAAIWLGEVRE